MAGSVVTAQVVYQLDAALAFASVVALAEPRPADIEDSRAEDTPVADIVVEGTVAGAFAAWGRPAALALVEPCRA